MNTDLKAELDLVGDILEKYYGKNGLAIQPTEPVVRLESIRKIINELHPDQWIKEGGMFGKNMTNFLSVYLKYCTKMPHPKNVNHQVSVPNPLSGVAGLITSATSNPMNIYEMGPAAAALEFFLVNYFLGKVGWRPQPYPDTPKPGTSGGGLLTHGGTQANLNAMVVARSSAMREKRLKENQQPLIVSSDVGHFSIAQAAFVMGAKDILVATDERGLMIPTELSRILTQHRDEGIIAVVANSCNTPVGTFDDLKSIAQICREHSVHLHIDAAHGGSLLMSKKLHHLLEGIEEADTIVWDTHKMMRVAGICTLLLARDRKNLDMALDRDASYIFHNKEQPGFDFMGRTLECTKASLALHLFHSLAYEGEDAIADYVDDVCDVTKQAFDILQNAGLKCALSPECNILCFRPPDFSDDAILKFRDRLRKEYNFFLSSTLFKGTRWLRLAIMSPHTQQKDIEELVRCFSRK